MTSFVLLALLMTVLTGAFILVPLWRQAAQNPDAIGAKQRRHVLWLAVGALALITVIYLAVGQPLAVLDATETPGDMNVASATPAQLAAWVPRLEARVRQQPDDAQAWHHLAKATEAQGRFAESVSAYRQWFARVPPQADALLDYAVTLGMGHQQSLLGEPEAAIALALKIEPHHVQALVLSGSAAFEAADYPRAVTQWQKALTYAPSDAPVRASVQAQVAQAQALQARVGRPQAPR